MGRGEPRHALAVPRTPVQLRPFASLVRCRPGRPEPEGQPNITQSAPVSLPLTSVSGLPQVVDTADLPHQRCHLRPWRRALPPAAAQPQEAARVRLRGRRRPRRPRLHAARGRGRSQGRDLADRGGRGGKRRASATHPGYELGGAYARGLVLTKPEAHSRWRRGERRERPRSIHLFLQFFFFPYFDGEVSVGRACVVRWFGLCE